MVRAFSSCDIHYFCFQETNFDKAVEKCKEVIKEDLDGKVLGKYLLTEYVDKILKKK